MEISMGKDQRLYTAVDKGDLDTIQNLLANGVVPDQWAFAIRKATIPYHLTPLNLAIYKRNRIAVEMLLKAKSDAYDMREYFLADSLAFSAEINELELFPLILISIDQSHHYSSYGAAMLKAAENGNIEIIRILLDAGADASYASWDGETALINAVIIRNLDIVKLLVEKGANVDFIFDEDSSSAIRIAIDNEFWEIVEYLFLFVRNSKDKRYAKRHLNRFCEELQPKTTQSDANKPPKKKKNVSIKNKFPKEIVLAAGIETPSGLRYIDIELGSGFSPEVGQKVLINYTSTQEDGVRRTIMRQYKMPVGRGILNLGLDEGILTMKVGGRRRLIIPPHLTKGLYGSVPPNTILIDDIELLGIES